MGETSWIPAFGRDKLEHIIHVFHLKSPLWVKTGE